MVLHLAIVAGPHCLLNREGDHLGSRAVSVAGGGVGLSESGVDFVGLDYHSPDAISSVELQLAIVAGTNRFLHR